jgi:signal transduction histidine kinase
VNRVSHELRTPLTNMLLNLDVVKDSLPEADTEPTSRLGLVREEAGRLARLIENVLTFSRREQGTLKLHAVECHPREVVDCILAQFTPAFARRGITVAREHEGDDASCVLASDALSQITANLFSNVEKYAPNVPVHVRTVQRADTFLLVVSDRGPGIPASEQERIFEPFARMDDRVNAGVTGTGLGLSIARELAQRMGGKLGMETGGKGACFILEIPLVAPLHAANGTTLTV